MTRQFARQLRKNMTDAERKLWSLLRRRQLLGYKFRRQQPLGPYIVDFVCLKNKLVIEVDGGQHAEQQDDDACRTQWLEDKGFKVVRFWNHDVLMKPESILQAIILALPPHPSRLTACRPPPPVGR